MVEYKYGQVQAIWFATLELKFYVQGCSLQSMTLLSNLFHLVWKILAIPKIMWFQLLSPKSTCLLLWWKKYNFIWSQEMKLILSLMSSLEKHQYFSIKKMKRLLSLWWRCLLTSEEKLKKILISLSITLLQMLLSMLLTSKKNV